MKTEIKIEAKLGEFTAFFAMSEFHLQDFLLAT
jgi:hypothetical protein